MKTVALIAAVACMVASLSAHAAKTEYAFRWNPDDGGPATAAEAAKKLGIQAGKARRFEVRYLTIKQPDGLPPGGYQAVARTDRRFNRMRPSIAPRKRHQAG